MKSVRIRSFSGSYFPAFGLKTGRSGPEKLQMQTLFTQWYFESIFLFSIQPIALPMCI